MSTSSLTKDGVFLNNTPVIDLPVGVIFVWLSTSLPTHNYLWCDGSIYDPVEYAELYSVIGISYGGTSTSPRLPNLLNRAPIGGKVSGSAVLSTLGSNEPTDVYNTTHLKTGGNSSLLPSQFIHTHSVRRYNVDHCFVNSITTVNNTDNDNGDQDPVYSQLPANQNPYIGNLTFGETGTSTHFPPHLRVNYIIFAGKKTSTSTLNKF